MTKAVSSVMNSVQTLVPPLATPQAQLYSSSYRRRRGVVGLITMINVSHCIALYRNVSQCIAMYRAPNTPLYAA
jgi:hypothetical protein